VQLGERAPRLRNLRLPLGRSTAPGDNPKEFQVRGKRETTGIGVVQVYFLQ